MRCSTRFSLPVDNPVCDAAAPKPDTRHGGSPAAAPVDFVATRWECRKTPDEGGYHKIVKTQMKSDGGPARCRRVVPYAAACSEMRPWASTWSNLTATRLLTPCSCMVTP